MSFPGDCGWTLNIIDSISNAMPFSKGMTRITRGCV